MFIEYRLLAKIFRLRQCFPLYHIIRNIARQRNLPQVAGFHRDGEIMLNRPAQLFACQLDEVCPDDFRKSQYKKNR